MVTLTYPAAWNPDAAKQKNIDEVIRRHLGGDLTATFGPHTATWRHPPAPPARALFDGYTLPAHRIHLATLRRRPEMDRRPGKRGTAPVHRGRHRRRQNRHRRRWLPRTPARTAG